MACLCTLFSNPNEKINSASAWYDETDHVLGYSWSVLRSLISDNILELGELFWGQIRFLLALAMKIFLKIFKSFSKWNKLKGKSLIWTFGTKHEAIVHL